MEMLNNLIATIIILFRENIVGVIITLVIKILLIILHLLHQE